MNATYTKLRTGDWGIRVVGFAKKGNAVKVTKKDGSTQTVTVGVVVWSGNGISLCTIQKTAPTPKPAPKVACTAPVYSQPALGVKTGCECGSLIGEYHDWYCSTCKFDDIAE